MKKYAIEAEGLSKRYYLGEDTTSQRFRHAVRNIFPNVKAGNAPELWALRDASFKIEPGEAIGVIGRNGAGKSTLLKLLSRITAPTEGRARLRGRVGTLLEVGTGFHPELTGRDNIYLSGTILGMSYNEVARRFDEIVAFAEIEEFIDTPVKRYSSGMYVRLAFAVASFLEPEILIVDEVLAVGDAAFQRKSLGRLSAASTEEGRTVLFVSHNLNAIRTFCRRTLVLEKGRLTFDGPVEEGLEHYLRSIPKQLDIGGTALKDRLNRSSGSVRFTRIMPRNESGESTWKFQQGETVSIRFEYEVFAPVPDLAFLIRLSAAVDQKDITTIRDTLNPGELQVGQRGAFDLTFPKIALRPGEFALYICLGRIDGTVYYDVADGNVDLPLLMITSDETDKYARQGVVSLEHSIRALDPEIYDAKV
jgi:lipopolysaccharide transport system ATP-binding protein